MVPAAFTSISSELRERFMALLDALSGLRILSMINVEKVTEEALLNEALAALVKHQDLEYCSIFLCDGPRLRCVAGTCMDEEMRDRCSEVSPGPYMRNLQQFSVGEGITGIACQTRQLQYCRNCQTDERFRPFDQAGTTHSVGSLIAVPICFGDEVLGVLNVSHPVPEFFDIWHQHMLLLFASMLGQMWHNYRMIHHLDKVVRSRTRSLERALNESEQLKRRYQELSSVDELTGLHNRRYFFAEAAAALERALRYSSPFTLLLMDVDHFKQINDRWGHVVGDRVLIQIARVLKEEMRSGDIVARMGGEEFAIVLPNTDFKGADLLAARIQEKLGMLYFGAEVDQLKVTACIGLASLAETGDAVQRDLVDRLYAQADRAMYECKRHGRNRRLCYHPAMGHYGAV